MIYASFTASLLTLIIYMFVIIRKSGLPTSISETYYRIEHRNWFTFVILIAAFCILPVAFEASTENTRFLIFLAVAGMAVVALAPNFAKGEKSERIAHYTGASMLLVFSQFWVYYNMKCILLLWAAYLAYIIYGLVKSEEASLYDSLVRLKAMFWAEVTLILTTYTAILIRL